MNGLKKIAGALALTLACAHAWASPTLTFSTPSAPVAAGSTVNVDVRIADVADLSAYNFSVLFDPALLHLDGAGVGAFLATGGDTFSDAGTIDNAGGALTLTFGSLLGGGAGANGGGVLLSLQFDALANGTATLNLSDLLFLDSAGNDIAVMAGAGIVQVGAANDVPEPASLALLAIGGVAALARRRTRARA